MGERVSIEDQKYFNVCCQLWCGDLLFEIEDFSDKFIDLKIIDVVSEKMVIWDDFNEQIGIEKFVNVKIMVEINQMFQGSGEKLVFSCEEICIVVGYENVDEFLLGEEDGDEEDEVIDFVV